MKRDPALLSVLKHWHGLTEAEWRRYKAKADNGERLNPIEAAEAQLIVERVKAWEAAGWPQNDSLPMASEVEPDR